MKFTLQAASILGASGILLAGCASKLAPEAPAYTLEFSAASDINADARNRPAPILVKVFALRSPSLFESSNFFNLQETPDATLGKDLVEMEQFVLRPGASKLVLRSGNPQVRSIGIMAEYRLFDTLRWRQWVALPEPKQAGRFSLWQTQPDRIHLRVNIARNGIELPGGLQ